MNALSGCATVGDAVGTAADGAVDVVGAGVHAGAAVVRTTT
ncbi:hypothetical protein [Acidithiobacillus acidisediminis]|nr:hypothetical protein [Acidithiobacillus sp. S30A2]